MLTKEEVLRIARLARLELSPEEQAFFQTRLDRVLEHVHELSGLSGQAAGEKTFVRHIPRDAVAFRGDTAVPSTVPAEIMKNAPAQDSGSFLLPAVMEGD